MFNLCNVQASEYDDYDVGKTVNLVTNNLGSFSVNNNYYVFDMNRLYTDFDIVSRNNISEVLISEQIEKNSMDFFKSYSISCGVSGEISAYSNNIYLSNTLSFSSTLHNYSFSGFYSYKKITKNRVDSLSNLLNDMSSYYCQEFLTACNNAYYTKNEDDYFRIFDNYGTHIILSAVYGHKLEKNAYCASNESTLYSFVDN
ncbi:MAG: MAC/perforin domain-containing protein [Anaeroplasmataceae bacterium]